MRKSLVAMMIDRGDLSSANQCRVRIGGGRIFATYHPCAGRGVSACSVCGRVVVRGMGRWWE